MIEALAMLRPRVRFTVRRMMVAMALLAFPLAGASQALKWSVISHARRDKAREFQQDQGVFDKLYRSNPHRAAYYQSMSTYCRIMEKKYRLGAEQPWTPMTPDPPIPPEPWPHQD